MTIIRMTANPSGAYPSPQDWLDDEIPEGFAAIPPEIDLRGFYDARGFVIPSFVGQSLTGYTVAQEALNAWIASHPAPDPLEAAFQSTPPVWGATTSTSTRSWTSPFQSTPPVWGATT